MIGRRTMVSGLAGIAALTAAPAHAGKDALLRCRKRSARARRAVRAARALAVATQGYFAELEMELDAEPQDPEAVAAARDDVRRYLAEVVARLGG